jgi:AmmeMemoRadiSam system protein B
MTPTSRSSTAIRPPAVAGTFYPDDPAELRSLVDSLVAKAGAGPHPAGDAPGAGRMRGLLVPHAGLAYSGRLAAAGWRLAAVSPAAGGGHEARRTVVILGTNHRARWLDGVGVWDAGSWRTPLGDVAVDEVLAAEILALGPPFRRDHAAHLGEHSIEVQLPFLQRLAPDDRIVPLAVSAGTSEEARAVGARLGTLVARRDAPDTRVIVAISSDMAHYPAHVECERATAQLLPSILALDAEELAAREAALAEWHVRSLVCGMCGIEPTVLGLAALAALGASRGTRVAAATSADAGGPVNETVGYLTVAFA